MIIVWQWKKSGWQKQWPFRPLLVIDEQLTLRALSETPFASNQTKLSRQHNFSSIMPISTTAFPFNWNWSLSCRLFWQKAKKEEKVFYLPSDVLSCCCRRVSETQHFKLCFKSNFFSTHRHFQKDVFSVAVREEMMGAWCRQNRVRTNTSGVIDPRARQRSVHLLCPF